MVTKGREPLPPADVMVSPPARSGFWARRGHLILAVVVGLGIGVGGGLYVVPKLARHGDSKGVAMEPRAISQPQVVRLAPQVASKGADSAPLGSATDHSGVGEIVAAFADAEQELQRVRWLSTSDREHMLRLRLHIKRKRWVDAINDDSQLPRYLQRLSIVTAWRAEVATARGHHDEAVKLLSEVAARRAISRQLRVRVLIRLSAALLVLKRPQAARQAAQRAVSWARRSGKLELQVAAKAQLGRCAPSS